MRFGRSSKFSGKTRTASSETIILPAQCCSFWVCEKTELTEARWSEFDLENHRWQLSGERSKSGAEIVIPLPIQTVSWLGELKTHACGSDYVFPNRRRSKQPHMGKDTLNRAIAKLFGREPGRKLQPENMMGGVAQFTVHDLRRTCRSLLAAEGVPGHVAERCLNHKLKGVEGYMTVTITSMSGKRPWLKWQSWLHHLLMAPLVSHSLSVLEFVSSGRYAPSGFSFIHRANSNV